MTVSDALERQVGPETAIAEALGRQVGPGTVVSEALGRQVGPGTAVSETLGRPVGWLVLGHLSEGLSDRFGAKTLFPLVPQCEAPDGNI